MAVTLWDLSEQLRREGEKEMDDGKETGKQRKKIQTMVECS